jgi:hypothetical protein
MEQGIKAHSATFSFLIFPLLIWNTQLADAKEIFLFLSTQRAFAST